jgi:hypothetical protein
MMFAGTGRGGRASASGPLSAADPELQGGVAPDVPSITKPDDIFVVPDEVDPPEPEVIDGQPQSEVEPEGTTKVQAPAHAIKNVPKRTKLPRTIEFAPVLKVVKFGFKR